MVVILKVMPDDAQESQKTITLRDIHPEWTDEQCERAEETLDQYLEVVVRIANRIFNDPKAYAEFLALTASLSKPYDDSCRNTPPRNAPNLPSSP